MGYFPNGSAGDYYENKYCDHCAHNHIEYGCPCLDSHIMWNYEECNNDNSILHKMIPRDKHGNNIQCRFFAKKGENGKPTV